MVVLGWSVLGLFVAGLLVPAGFVTGARLTSSPGLGWVVLRALTPLAVLPYALALVALAAGWGLAHGRSRAVLATLAAVVAAVLALHLSWVGGAFVGGAPAAASSTTARVMSVNLRLGEADADSVMRIARTEHVQVLVLEEVTPAALGRLGSAGLRERFAYSVGEPRAGRDGVMVFSVRRLRPVATLATSSPGYVADADVAGRRVRLIAVHPLAPNHSVARWSADHALVRRTAAASWGPVMVVGDFNATLDHEPLQRLVALGYRDAAAEAGSGWQPTWPSAGLVRVLGRGLPPFVQLDHVFVRGGPHATWTRTFTVPGTDHRALVAQVSL